jgi:hypothetical protein
LTKRKVMRRGGAEDEQVGGAQGCEAATRVVASRAPEKTEERPTQARESQLPLRRGSRSLMTTKRKVIAGGRRRMRRLEMPVAWTTHRPCPSSSSWNPQLRTLRRRSDAFRLEPDHAPRSPASAVLIRLCVSCHRRRPCTSDFRLFPAPSAS